MRRRDFLERTGWFVVGASLVGIPGCSDDKPETPPGETPEPEAKGTYSFPQGVGSGDPRDSSVVLWTRVVRNADDKPVTVNAEVSADPAFGSVVVARLLNATSGSDHTLRLVVTNLAANTQYYYRFTAGQDTITGRTHTAPAATADVQINLAWVSCQDYAAGHYGAYRQMIIDDDARPAADRIFAVVHLGDMIYETRENGFQTAIDEKFAAISLTNRDGSQRGVAAFPTGGTRVGISFAKTVDDYRHLYRTFFSDPDLQAARARWPFVCVWDDHEFTDDCWQSQANYDSTSSFDEGDQVRRVAASQAWFEYIPAHLTDAPGVDGVDSPSKDFKQVTVKDALFDSLDADNFTDEPNNVAAVGAITIYRSLRWGKHVELVMTDERSYRSDHAIPEDLITSAVGKQVFAAPRNALPMDMVNILDAGNTANDGDPPIDVLPPPGSPPGTPGLFQNVRIATPPGTMLGAAQKQWWKDTMKGSDATWKLWGNEVSLMRMRIKANATVGVPLDLIISGDAWDGYNTERKELMGFLRDEEIKNVVVLSGDIHASFAGKVVDDFDADAADRKVVACELVAAGISSNSLFSFFEFATRTTATRPLIIVDATSTGGSEFTENLNLLLRHGTLAAGAFATNKVVIPQTFDDTTNPHLAYVDTNAQGYGYVKVGKEQVDATLVTVNRPITTPSDAAPTPGIKRTASFTIPIDAPGDMTGPVFTGTKPFPET
ncbi:MAG TPA: alkaline phosphatase D family protein [Kofleriaceae bacterium]|nr:alkaline phosphatase D family protein [Kofleriaceae bacterium]